MVAVEASYIELILHTQNGLRLTVLAAVVMAKKREREVFKNVVCRDGLPERNLFRMQPRKI